MKTATLKKPGDKKLVKNPTPIRHDIPKPVHELTKKGSRQAAAPYLRAHRVNGHTYYSYCHGTDKEIYLGSADTILKAVKRLVIQ